MKIQVNISISLEFKRTKSHQYHLWSKLRRNPSFRTIVYKRFRTLMLTLMHPLSNPRRLPDIHSSRMGMNGFISRRRSWRTCGVDYVVIDYCCSFQWFQSIDRLNCQSLSHKAIISTGIDSNDSSQILSQALSRKSRSSHSIDLSHSRSYYAIPSKFPTTRTGLFGLPAQILKY